MQGLRKQGNYLGVSFLRKKETIFLTVPRRTPR